MRLNNNWVPIPILNIKETLMAKKMSKADKDDKSDKKKKIKEDSKRDKKIDKRKGIK